MITLQQGDCLELMKNLPDESIDLVVTDCPYKIIAGSIRIEYENDEPSGIFNKRDYSKTDPKGVLNRGKIIVKAKCKDFKMQKNVESWCTHKSSVNTVKDGKMFEHNDIKFKAHIATL